MKTKKDILSMMLLLIFAFVFFITITQMPAKSIAADDGSGTFCDTNKKYYCWTSGHKWKCDTDEGDTKCADPVQE